MHLPEELRRAIDEHIASLSPPELARASAELTSVYRGERTGKPRLDRVHRAAYLLTRMPAIFAVLSRVLAEVRLRAPETRIESVLDLGAGPGTLLWAAVESFPELVRATLVEVDADWIATGKQLGQSSKHQAVRGADWISGDISKQIPAGKYDLVTVSYVMNELRPAEIAAITRQAWDRTGKILIVVEPGTPLGFAHIRDIRAGLINLGAQMLAPCPHVQACPMAANDWCHFAQRVQRTSAHRLAKAAELGYEDEKYSYVAFARQAFNLPQARIVRHPRKRSGHVEFEVCAAEGLKRETLSKKHGDTYKKARKLEWGDALTD
jgi:ribosomal protein RSM22 (predicted rRNA methylase)